MKFFVQIVVAIGVLTLTRGSYAQSFKACQGMFPENDVPKATASSDVDLCKFANDRAIFAIRYNTSRKIPEWAAHKLSPEDLKNLTKRKRPRFFPDKNVDQALSALDKSYVRSGFSRGHIVPAYDMSWNADAYRATFNLTNVVPQKQSFNAGTWLGLEKTFRKLVQQKNRTLWIISGVYGQVAKTPTIGTAPHSPVVPKCFYKIIIAQGDTGQRYKVLAALFAWNNFQKQKKWRESITTLAQVNKRTGIDFLANVAVENTYDAPFWGVPLPHNIGDCH